MKSYGWLTTAEKGKIIFLHGQAPGKLSNSKQAAVNIYTDKSNMKLLIRLYMCVCVYVYTYIWLYVTIIKKKWKGSNWGGHRSLGEGKDKHVVNTVLTHEILKN